MAGTGGEPSPGITEDTVITYGLLEGLLAGIRAGISEVVQEKIDAQTTTLSAQIAGQKDEIAAVKQQLSDKIDALPDVDAQIAKAKADFQQTIDAALAAFATSESLTDAIKSRVDAAVKATPPTPTSDSKALVPYSPKMRATGQKNPKPDELLKWVAV